MIRNHFLIFPRDNNRCCSRLALDLRELSTSLACAFKLCNQISILPIQLAQEANSPPPSTATIDFSPSRLSGIGPLTQNLDGCGLRVIVVGDKAKGIVECWQCAEHGAHGVACEGIYAGSCEN